MAVVVLPEVDRELRESQSLLIEVRSDDGQLPSAVAALRQALLRLTGTGPDGQPEGVAFLPPPVPLPGAQLLLAELTIGEPEQWLPGQPDVAAVREHGRRILAPCLVGEAQAVAMAAAGLGRFRAGAD
ncbi:hypothetical protein [Micromonospora sp. 4G55]|uniref:hypothetical protein n=1 Tax=Micromonospora sp. 4G55 TaxID=2806102 RepID=UPI001A3DFFA4|nr:hypothetical protein [Micromonospora sp. 4G55]MBM0258887.1 hypothetical protein [Micromonospora sp. 4G55]